MAREITHDATGPLRLDEDDIAASDGTVLLCRCGLSAEYPFCDGSHRVTADEAPDRRYKYAGDRADGERREVRVVDTDENAGGGDDDG